VSLDAGCEICEGSCFVKFGDYPRIGHRHAGGRFAAVAQRQARGWVTAEYGMLPRATSERTRREASSARERAARSRSSVSSGVSLRAVLDLRRSASARSRLIATYPGDGGTRTAGDHRRMGGAA